MPPRWSGILQPELLARSAHKICEITQFPSPLHFELGTPIQPAYCTPHAHKGADQYLVGQPSPVLATLPIISPAVLMPQARAYPDFDSRIKRFAAASEKTTTASPDLGTKCPHRSQNGLKLMLACQHPPRTPWAFEITTFQRFRNFIILSVYPCRPQNTEVQAAVTAWSAPLQQKYFIFFFQTFTD